MADLTLLWPIQGARITTPYGGCTQAECPHYALDLSAPEGTPVVSASQGTVVQVGWDNSGYGNEVVVKTPEGNIVGYGHLQTEIVSLGQTVDYGTGIGTVGSTGNSTGPHTHFFVHDPTGKPLDPTISLIRSRDVGSPQPSTPATQPIPTIPSPPTAQQVPSSVQSIPVIGGMANLNQQIQALLSVGKIPNIVNGGQIGLTLVGAFFIIFGIVKVTGYV